MKLTQHRAAKKEQVREKSSTLPELFPSHPVGWIQENEGYIIIKMNLDFFARELINPRECSGWSRSALGLVKSCRLAIRNQNKTITKPLKPKPKPETIKSAANFFISPRKSFRVCPHLIPSLPEHPRPS